MTTLPAPYWCHHPERQRYRNYQGDYLCALCAQDASNIYVNAPAALEAYWTKKRAATPPETLETAIRAALADTTGLNEAEIDAFVTTGKAIKNKIHDTGPDGRNPLCKNDLAIYTTSEKAIVTCLTCQGLAHRRPSANGANDTPKESAPAVNRTASRTVIRLKSPLPSAETARCARQQTDGSHNDVDDRQPKLF